MKGDFCDCAHHFSSATQGSLWEECCFANLFVPFSCTAVARVQHLICMIDKKHIRPVLRTEKLALPWCIMAPISQGPL